jgi:hypothetical protein
MEMKPKRPRLQNAKSNAERQENSIIDTVSTGHIGPIEEESWPEGKLPDFEISDLKEKKLYEPIVLVDYEIVADIKQSDVSDDENTAVVKNIYDTIDFDPGF